MNALLRSILPNKFRRSEDTSAADTDARPKYAMDKDDADLCGGAKGYENSNVRIELRHHDDDLASLVVQGEAEEEEVERPSVGTLIDHLNSRNNDHSRESIHLPISEVAIGRCSNDFYYVVGEARYRFGNRIVYQDIAFTDGKVDTSKFITLPWVRELTITKCHAVSGGVKVRVGWAFWTSNPHTVFEDPNNGNRIKVKGTADVVIEDDVVFKSRDTKRGTACGYFANNPLPVYVGIRALREAAGALVDTLPVVNK